jgi:hypothetical protein
MAQAFESISDDMRSFIDAQHIFFVATAPAEGGHINLSPKGKSSFRVLGPKRVAYLDMTGSGAETIAHLRQNGRITFMFCAFEGRPRIVRVYGEGRVRRPDDPEFVDLMPLFEDGRGIRSIIEVDVNRTADSCGYSVPKMSWVEDRDTLDRWVAAKSDEELGAYREKNNRRSIDGLPAL